MSSDHHSAGGDIRQQLQELAQHLEHVLPAQAPIKDFVHHNTLHGYQHLHFTQAVTAARQLTGASAYLPDERFREFYAQGRISRDDLETALREASGLDTAAVLVQSPSGPITLGEVMFVALRHPIKHLSRSQLKWQVEEMRALSAFQPDVTDSSRSRLMSRAHSTDEAAAISELWAACVETLDLEHASLHPEDLLEFSADPSETEALANAAEQPSVARQIGEEAHQLLDEMLDRLGGPWTLRTLLRTLTGEDLLDELRPLLIRHISAHLDQGLAAWHNPRRLQGFYAAWRESAAADLAWVFADLPEWKSHLERLPDNPLDAIIQELGLLGLPEARWTGYLERLALEIPGWSGMALWRHAHANYAGMSAPVEILDFLAVRLVLERIFSQRLCRRHWRIEASLDVLRWHFHHHAEELVVRHALFEGRLPEYLASLAQRQVQEAIQRKEAVDEITWRRLAGLLWAWRQIPAADRRGGASVAGSAWPLFLLAQHLGLCGSEIRAIGRSGVEQLLANLTRLDADQTGYVWLNAYERHYREQIFSAIAANHARWQARPDPEAQLVFCMDDREEGMRRHLEEINPRLETFGAAAHFSVFINWYGLDDREPTVLCPVVARPAHEVRELPRSGSEDIFARHRQRLARRLKWKEILHQGTRRGLLAPALLSAAAAPATLAVLFSKIFLPGRFGQFVAGLAKSFDQNVPTRIEFTAPADSTPATPDAPRPTGFTDIEQTDRVQAFLRNIGLTRNFAPLVIITGHGSNSQNNPHLSAYDCGACSGRHSGSNARLLAAMANRPEVRTILAERGIHIPTTTWLLGAEHNTGDESITWYDLEDIPTDLRDAHTKLDHELSEASRAHAQERCRRLVSAPLDISKVNALHHVIGRRYDFSQARPELGHATNACAFIGRRSLSRGAFFDRRSFLISYDPTQDPEGKILEGQLLANGPVGAGISLEYYFSTVNNEQYGCGTKTMHNIAGLLGVMEGASSDLRTGLPRQMIEIHEAMRLLVVVENKIGLITAIYQRQPPLQELIGNGWLVVAAKDPDSPDIHLFDPARGWVKWEGSTELPHVESSADWFTGQRDPLPPVLLTRPVPLTQREGEAA